MYILLVFLYMRSGDVLVRYSTTSTLQLCEESREPLERLYQQGKFPDGPVPINILHTLSRCEKI